MPLPPPMRWLLAVTAVVALASPSVGSAQTVRGLVTEDRTGEPIAIATVTLVSESGENVADALTTEEGFFSLDAVGAGMFIVRATALGYAPGRLGPFELGDETVQVVELRMTVAAVGIEGLLVEGAREGSLGNSLTQRGFWERYAEGRGQFLTPGEVLASDAMFTPHLLRGMKNVLPQYGVAPWAMWPALGITESRSCEPRVYVDNVWVNRAGFGLRDGGLGLDDIVPIERVAAVEVYDGSFQAPMRYQGTLHDNSCGVVLLWTR